MNLYGFKSWEGRQMRDMEIGREGSVVTRMES